MYNVFESVYFFIKYKSFCSVFWTHFWIFSLFSYLIWEIQYMLESCSQCNFASWYTFSFFFLLNFSSFTFSSWDTDCKKQLIFHFSSLTRFISFLLPHKIHWKFIQDSRWAGINWGGFKLSILVTYTWSKLRSFM